MLVYYVYDSEISLKEGYPLAGFERYEDAKDFVSMKRKQSGGILSPFADYVIVRLVELEVKENEKK